MKITIAGTPGAGKDTVKNILAKELNLKVFSTGGHMREMANKRGISLLELSRIANNDPLIDKELDSWQKELGETQDDFILDARLGYKFIPDSIKIYLKTTLEEGSKRIFNHKAESRKNEANNTSVEETIKNTKERVESERKRYLKSYNVNLFDESPYDLSIDTTNISAQEVANKIIEFVKKN